MLTKLRKIIVEELSISNEVIKLSKELYKKILGVIKGEPESEEKSSTCIKRSYSLEFKVREAEVSIGVTYRNFLSKGLKPLYTMPYVTNGSSVFASENLFLAFINIYGICGTIDKQKALETIQHEVEHIYQQTMMKKPFGGENLYAKAKTDMEFGDEKRHDIGRLVYYCEKSEQEGFANSLYAYLMDMNKPYYEEDLVKSETWQNYIFMKEIIDKLEKGKDQELISVFKEYTEEFHLSLLKVKTAVEQFLRRIGRTIIKVQKDKTVQGWR